MTIDIELWKPHPDKPGFVVVDRVKTVQEVFDELVAKLEEEKLIDEYFTISSTIKYGRDDELNRDKPFPDYRWIASYAVTGGNEGHYIHIDVINHVKGSTALHNTALSVFVGKTFQGMEHAQNLASRCAELLGA